MQGVEPAIAALDAFGHFCVTREGQLFDAVRARAQAHGDAEASFERAEQALAAAQDAHGVAAERLQSLEAQERVAAEDLQKVEATITQAKASVANAALLSEAMDKAYPLSKAQQGSQQNGQAAMQRSHSDELVIGP